jgi:hypothetical protein
MTPKIQRALVTTLIVLGVMFVGFFGLRTLRAFKDFRGHRPPPPFGSDPFQQAAETDVELIRDWMTIPYISRMYQVPPKVLFEAVDISPRDKNDEKSLKQLNDEYFPSEEGVVMEKVKAAISAHQPPTAPTSPGASTAPSAP